MAKKVQKAAVYAMAEALISKLQYNDEFGLYELSGDDLFTVDANVVELAAKELRITLQNAGMEKRIMKNIHQSISQSLQKGFELGSLPASS